MKLSDLLPGSDPPEAKPLPVKLNLAELKAWMQNIDSRVRRVEKLTWTLLGALPVLQLVRACSEG